MREVAYELQLAGLEIVQPIKKLKCHKHKTQHTTLPCAYVLSELHNQSAFKDTQSTLCAMIS